MAPKKKAVGLIKLQIQAGAANPAPPIGPALGQHGVNIMEFCTAYNNADKLAREVAGRVRSIGSAPTCVGVGVSTGAQVRDVNTYADGAIVGTALIAAYESKGLDGLIEKTRELASGLG